MPRNNFIYAIFVIVFAASIFSIACKKASNETNISGATDSTAASKIHETKVKIKTPDDMDVLEVKMNGENIKLEMGAKIIRSESTGDKRKYFYEAGSQIAEVKANDQEGFKLRGEDGKLLWKIKISSDKIKISDNEENANPFEIVKKADGAKIEFNETKLGEVKFYKDRGKIKVKNASDREIFDTNTDKYSIAYGTLLLEEIPEELRFIIFAELLDRNL